MENVQILLSRNDLGQLLEGIDVLVEHWEATEEYLATGRVQDNVCIRESHSVREAQAIAIIYRDLRDRIRDQAN